MKVSPLITLAFDQKVGNMNFAIQQALALNNSALLHFHNGNLDEAYPLLRQATAILRDHTDPEKALSHGDQISQDPHKPSLWLSPVDSQLDIEQFQDKSSSYMFHQGIYLNGDVSGTDSCETVCAVVLFNMALTRHMKALASDSATTRMQYEGTSKIYKMALCMLAKLTVVTPSSELLAVAALNNTCLIADSVSDTEEVTRHCVAMRNILASPSSNRDDVFSFFYLNMLYFQAKCTTASAA